MPHIYFDASAPTKPYLQERGTNYIDTVFDNVPLERLMCASLGALEIFWICVRRRNDGRLTPHQFFDAVNYLDQELSQTSPILKCFLCPITTCVDQWT